MDDKAVNALISNESEWRRFMVKKIGKIEEEQVKIKEDLAAQKVWIWVGRGFFIVLWGGMFTWIKAQIK